LKNKDLIVNTKGVAITSFDQFKNILDSSKGQQIQVSVLRNNESKDLTVQVDSSGKIGFMPGFELPKDKYKMQQYGFFESMKYGANECVKLFTMQAISISKMVTREMDFKENVGGPIAMAKGFGVEWDWYRFWLFTAMISVGLAFMNLLPIPALDGGHAVVILIEMITGKPVNEKVLQFLQNVGTIIILGLMVFVFYNDLTRK
jgi:regulator of sigma E protease